MVLQCQEHQEDPKDRDEFLTLLGAAFATLGLGLHKDVRAQLLLAYHWDKDNQVHGFPSNNAVHRGHPRPGRKKQAMSRGCRACSSHEQPEEVNEGAEEVNEGAEESQEDDDSILGSVFELPVPENNEDESYYMPYDPYSGYWAVPSEALVWWPSDALAPGNWTMVVMPEPGAYEETYINPPYMPPQHPSNRRPDWRGRRGLLTASGRPNTQNRL